MASQDISLDDLSVVLDGLPPEDLDGHHGIDAATEVFYVPAPAGSLQGRTAFDAFLRAQLRVVRTTSLASTGPLSPIAVLATPDTERVYAPVTDETVTDFLARLRFSAHVVGARWLFLAHQPDDTDDAVRYFAERREDGDADTRFGVVRSSGRSHPRDLDENLVGHLVEKLAVSTVFSPSDDLLPDVPSHLAEPEPAAG